MTSKGNLYTHQRGAFDVARFDNLGNAKALTRGTSDTGMAPRLCVIGNRMLNNQLRSLLS